MAASWIVSNLLHENFGENDETQQMLQTITAKYIEREKMELHAQIARVETIRLQLETGNSLSILSSLIEITDAQYESDAHLEDYYKLHLGVFFDMECEMEKINSYDEIKLELESRDSIHFHHQLYLRKLKVATNMEARNIAKKYRKIEQELLKSQDDLIALEKSMVKSKENNTDLNGLIYRLVKGSKDLKFAHSFKAEDKNSVTHQYPPDTIDVTKTSNQPTHKRGLSARLSLGLTNFKMPFVPCLPKIRTIDSTRLCVRLLQQSEDLRRAMQKATDEPSIPKISGILKNPMELPTPLESIRKTVSFQSDLPEEIHASQDSLSSISAIDKETTYEPTSNTELKENFTDVMIESSKKLPVEILENIIIKLPRVESTVQTAEPSNVPRAHLKRKIIEAEQNVAHSPPKIKRTDDQDQSMASRSFMDMFLDMSKENLTVSSTLDESKENDKQNVANPSTENRKESTKRNIKKLGKKSKDSFDDFEDFFSGFAGNDKNVTDEVETLDFFGCIDENADNDDGTGGSDNSFNF